MPEEKTYIAKNIETAGEKAAYDTQVKNLFRDKNILAMILMYTMPEFSGYSRDMVKACIEGNAEIAAAPVLSAIHGMNTEDAVNHEGEITYDIKFYVRIPHGDSVKIIIDLEAQRKYHPGYDLVTRGVFYGARMLSAQLDTEFSTANYDDLKKVYSIWICMDVPRYAQNTITEYSLHPTQRYGRFSGKARYDLLSVVMVCLGTERSIGNELHQMLYVLLSDKISVKEKEHVLESEYAIPMTQELKEGFSHMCNLSETIEEKGIKKGIEKGIEKERNNTRRILRSMGLSEEEIEAKLKAADESQSV